MRPVFSIFYSEVLSTIRHLIYHRLALSLSIFLIVLTSCLKLDDINERLDKVESDVMSLDSVVKSLKDAYCEGKIVTSVAPFEASQESGWLITFSDNASIRVLNGIDGKDGRDGEDGKDGITPYFKIGSDGYWTISYDNGHTFIRLLNNDGEPIMSGAHADDKGEEGKNIRMIVNEEDFYVIQTYHESVPDIVIDEIITPYTANACCVFTSIIQDDKTHTVTVSLADGSEFKLSMHYVFPTSIALLNVNPLYLARGTQASVEFRINPSNALFEMNGEACPIELDMVGTLKTRSSYVTTPSNYRLVRIEQVYDTKTEQMKTGQYRAIIEDTKKSLEYDEMAALVLNVKDANGDMVQVSSNAFEIKSFLPAKTNELSTIYINTPNSQPITSKEYYVEGATFSIVNSDNSIDFQGEMKIKGRGNSTWSKPKKPYKIKFDKAVSLFEEPKDKEWILLANYFDKSLIRNEVAFWMASKFGQFDYVPKFHFVDLVLNGSYYGNYQIGNQLKISDNIVNAGDDGFLLEIDAKTSEDDVTFKIPHFKRPINIKDPAVTIGDADYTYVVDYLTHADEVLFDSAWLDTEKGYKSLIDMQSFVEWYLMMEITKNNDAVFYSSCYMNLSRTGKLKMGPLWDFDLSMGGYPVDAGKDFVNEPEDFYIMTNTHSWIERLFQDPEFVAAVKLRFQSYYYNKTAILEHIDRVASANKQSAIANNKVWGTLCDINSSESAMEKAYDKQISDIKYWLATRLEWLKTAYEEL